MSLSNNNKVSLQWSIITTSELSEYSDQIINMYKKSYENLGLRQDLLEWNKLSSYLNCSCYALMRSNDNIPKIKAAILYWLSNYGNKISIVVSDTPDIAKKYVIPKLIELIKTPGFFIELSDALEHMVRKAGIDNIKDKSIIKKLTSGLKDEDIFDENDVRCYKFKLGENPSPSGSYVRVIPGGIGENRKALYGIPCMTEQFTGSDCNRKCITKSNKTNMNKSLNGGSKKKTKKNKKKY